MSDTKLAELTQYLIGKTPKAPQLPRKEIVSLLKRLRAGIDKLIVKLEKAEKPVRKAPAKKAAAKKSARKRAR